MLGLGRGSRGFSGVAREFEFADCACGAGGSGSRLQCVEIAREFRKDSRSVGLEVGKRAVVADPVVRPGALCIEVGLVGFTPAHFLGIPASVGQGACLPVRWTGFHKYDAVASVDQPCLEQERHIEDD